MCVQLAGGVEAHEVSSSSHTTSAGVNCEQPKHSSFIESLSACDAAGDFGLVKLLLGKYYITNRSGSGTVTHLAPELFEVRVCIVVYCTDCADKLSL
jgi:hypothetical protein